MLAHGASALGARGSARSWLFGARVPAAHGDAGSLAPERRSSAVTRSCRRSAREAPGQPTLLRVGTEPGTPKSHAAVSEALLLTEGLGGCFLRLLGPSN